MKTLNELTTAGRRDLGFSPFISTTGNLKGYYSGSIITLIVEDVSMSLTVELSNLFHTWLLVSSETGRSFNEGPRLVAIRVIRYCKENGMMYSTSNTIRRGIVHGTITSYDGRCGHCIQAAAILYFMTFKQRQTTTENS